MRFGLAHKENSAAALFVYGIILIFCSLQPVQITHSCAILVLNVDACNRS